MKKRLFLLSSIVVLSLIGCNNNKAIDNQKEVNEIKALLNKQDLSPFYERMFNANYLQSFSVYSNSIYEDEEETQFFKYDGLGMYGFFYSVEEEDYEEIISQEEVNPFDFMSRGISGYDIRQSVDIDAYSLEKHISEAETITSRTSLEYYQSLTALFNEENVQIASQVTIDDRFEDEHDEVLNFNGLISNEILLDSVSTSTLNDVFLRMSMFDGQRSTEFLDGLYYDVCKDLLTKTDRELSKFIKLNHLSLEEGEEYTELKFKIEDESILNILSDNDVFPGLIEGTLYYEKDTGSFANFRYEITYMNNEVDSEDGLSTHSANLNMIVQGYSYHETFPGTPYIQPDPTIYDDANQYMADFVRNAIPTVI